MFNNKMSSHVLVSGIAALMMVLPWTCQADDQDIADLGKIATSVKEMLAKDTSLALKAEHQRELELSGVKTPTVAPAIPLNLSDAIMAPPAGGGDKDSAAKEKPAPAISVTGIYGTGDALSADVMIDGKRIRFTKGRALPDGYSKFAYQLVSINSPCVLLKANGANKKLCIDGIGE